MSQLEGDTAIVGRQYAVLIAIDKYKTRMALRKPVKDAKEIKDILSRKYYFSDFIELYDEAATKADIGTAGQTTDFVELVKNGTPQNVQDASTRARM